MPCVLNAANEVANLAFREERIAYPRIAEILQTTMAKAEYISTPTYEDYVETDAAARRLAAGLL